MKLALVKELYDAADAAVKAKIDAAAAAYKAQGAEVEEISLANLPEIQTAWTILMSAETTNNLSRFDPVKYGYRTEKYKNIDELYVGSRTEAFGFLTKATIIYGSDVLSKGRYEDCYDKALKIRRVVVDTLAELFKNSGYNALLTPACSSADFETYPVDEAFGKVFEESLFTATASITGLPAVVGSGVQLVGNYFCDGLLLGLAKVLEKEEA
jgi:aspartyl-tRNA(Asn)/glutamyl-tRNA(Gln) amidotransferase subunit A